MGELKTIYDSLGKHKETVFNAASSWQMVPREFVGYHFAWKQMAQDLVKLLKAPSRVTKRFNYLLERAGKESVLRSSMKYDLPGLTSPAFTYDIFDVTYETNRSFETVHKRQVELIGMASLYFDFPKIALPVLKAGMVSDMYGLVPRFIDIYKLMPWSWLIDWFTGLGNYLQAIEAVNLDKSTINYGFCTVKLRGEIRTRYVYTAEIREDSMINASPYWVSTVKTKVGRSHESYLMYEAVLRRGANEISQFKMPIIGLKTNLTSLQQLILGALLAARKY